MAELPFLATERILVWMVTRAGADRQECHERIRSHSQAAGAVVKLEGRPNDLVARLRGDPYFAPITDKFDTLLDPRAFIGRALGQVRVRVINLNSHSPLILMLDNSFQVDYFLEKEVAPALEPYTNVLDEISNLVV